MYYAYNKTSDFNPQLVFKFDGFEYHSGQQFYRLKARDGYTFRLSEEVLNQNFLLLNNPQIAEKLYD